MKRALIVGIAAVAAVELAGTLGHSTNESATCPACGQSFPGGLGNRCLACRPG